ncbi:phage antirepressor N-terminal domain-containing protein [Candidatus Magnetaquicoccus inordinatus]|uniref:phage antirepressor N-terminal domain-containing protein n=1 Tax=Candidatus Magnetaquicoccus inordinatus TaxID=2496818 RepID=UPI00102B0FBD|nr:phage antirepressor N-terminal domain-containing protein [Candidatus Magnetaquicoccus inordinatus]
MNAEEISQLIPVPFRGDQLFIVEHNGEPYVPMRPVVEAMGLEWARQADKLHNPKFNCVHMSTVAQDGKQREMVCIPLRKLNGWLFSVNAKKVRPDLKAKVEAYQEECFTVLYDYWTKGEAVNPRSRTEKVPFLERDPEWLTNIVDNLCFTHDKIQPRGRI